MRPHIMILLAIFLLVPTASAGPLDILDVSVKVGNVHVSTREAPPTEDAARTQTVQGEPASVRPVDADAASPQPGSSVWRAATANPWLLVVVILGTMLFVGVLWSGYAEQRAAKKA